MAKHLTGNTTLMGQGIIPFDSDDESVLINCDLKSLANVEAAGGAQTGTPTFSDNGMTNTDDANHVMFTVPAGYADLDVAGQFSIDVPVTLVANKDGAFSPPAASNLITWADADSESASPYGRLYKIIGSGTGAIQMELSVPDANLQISASAFDTEEYATITMSWIGSTVTFYFDGRLITTTPRVNGVTADLMKFIWIGTERGKVAGANQLFGYSLKNLVVATRPVMLAGHPALAKTVFVSHSFMSSIEDYPKYQTSIAYGWDKDLARSTTGYLANKGLNCFPVIHATSSGALDSTVGAAVDLDADFTLAVAERPTCMIVLAGTNDVSTAGYDVASFLAEYKAYVDALAVTADIIICCTVPTSIGDTDVGAILRATLIENTATANAAINTLPAYNSKCIVADLFTVLGGETEGTNLWNGVVAGTYTDRHPTAKACRIMGETIAEKIYTAL